MSLLSILLELVLKSPSMLRAFVCCQSLCRGLGVTAVPQLKAVELPALLMGIEWIGAVWFQSWSTTAFQPGKALQAV